MHRISERSPLSLPPTVNLHLVAVCNMRCRYCYARFLDERDEQLLPVEDVVHTMRELASHGVRRVTFAGGEPTLHPHLASLLAAASDLGLVTALVSNGVRIDKDWIDRHGPHLRWLTLSIDSVDPQRARKLGRHAGSSRYSHPDHVLEVAALVHAWNSQRPMSRRIRLKLNITVTAENVREDPSDFIRRMRPTKVKALQMLMVRGENDDAGDLQCKAEAFTAYVNHIAVIDGVEVVVEDNDAMDGSYAMVDPRGRFYQRVDGRYRQSAPIHEVGAMEAWKMVGGYDSQRFLDRGGNYEPGAVARGNVPYLVAIEGLDGSGKSTVARRLAERLAAKLVGNPPAEMIAERTAADSASPAARRDWYLRANERAAQIAEDIRRERRLSVVMDRSVASTLAFGAAESGQPVAHWPTTIVRPDLLVLLSVPEPERQRRIAARGLVRTAEESRLDQDVCFREQVLRNYEALGAARVDASGAIDDVVDAIVTLLGQV
jgi:radical S-adenosyl methionine domain-containing protein 2